MIKKSSILITLFIIGVFFNLNVLGEELKILKTVSSSMQDDNYEFRAENAIDRKMQTRWSSSFSDPQWIMFDFGSKKAFNLISITWEAAYGKVYEIQTSNDASNWKTIFKEKNGNGDRDIIFIKQKKARYVRMYGIRRGGGWGYSIFEFKISKSDSKPPVSPSNLSTLTGNNIIVLDWDDNTESDFDGYNIYRSTKLNGKYEKINTDFIKLSKYIDKTVKNETHYYYQVKAVDLFNKQSQGSTKTLAIPLPIKKEGTYLDPNLSIEERVNDLLSRMSLQEKVEQLSGLPKYDKNFDNMSTYLNERLGIPRIKCADGPHGVTRGKSTTFPVLISLASTWEPELMERMGSAIGKELIAKGRNQSLGPCLNICKDPRAGRTHEGYGEDVYLTSKMAVASIKGIQSQKVIATPKHFACNNIEIGRGGGPVEVDEITLREIYLPAFKACVKEGNAWSIMGAYNKVNGSYCCANKHLLTDILKDEWGFQGFVITDWGGCHSTVKSITAGLDLEMPETRFYGDQLVEAVEKGIVSEEIINDSVGRILSAKFWAGLFDKQLEIDPSIVECKEHIELAKEIAKKSIVLLKNKNSLLPLDKDKIKSIAVLGPSAKLTTTGVGLGSGQVFSSYTVTPLEGIKNKVGNKIKITDDPKGADVAIVFVGLTESIAERVEGEGTDRSYLHLPGNQDALIKEISQINKNTIVVLIGGTAITMDKWINSVPAIIEAWYPGQEGGNAIADVLFGDYNPGGKLPITFPKSMGQLLKFDWNYEDEYKTGVGYCYYDKNNLMPLFPFGYGLSYTDFKYSDLKIDPEQSKDGNINVSITIKNIGKRKGDEVVQLYLQDVESSIERPIKQVKGFKRVTLEEGESKRINFVLKPEALAFYNKDIKFVVEPGAFKVMIGSSSRDIRLTGSFEVTEMISEIE